MELDQLYKRLQRPYQFRLDNLQQHEAQVQERDDLVLEEATLLNQLKRYEEAMQMLDNRMFHVWEGGEGKVSGQYQICRLEIAKRLIAEKKELDRAIDLLQQCLVFPHNIGEGKLYGAQDNDFYYFMGKAFMLKGEKHIFDHITMDYFAVSLPDLLVWDGNLDEANQIHCNYMLSLGNYGLGNAHKGRQYLDKVLALNINHFGALALSTFVNL